MSAALFLPIFVLVFGLLIPLGAVTADHAQVHAVLRNPIIMLVLFGVLTLSLFHWAHRFRHVLIDGFRLRPFALPISVACYGTAAIGAVITAVVAIGVR